MHSLTLALGEALPWLLGWALLAAGDWPRRDHTAGGAVALRLGFSYVVGAVLLTLWMRALSALGVPFGRLSIALPLTALAVVLLALDARRSGRRAPDSGNAMLLNRLELPFSLATVVAPLRSLWRPALANWQRIVWIALIIWLAIRFALLAAALAWQPLYPWDAWAQWATKARVWYELGHMAPFVHADVWLTRASDAYFDAAPTYPATMPLLQVWGCIALGSWDDSAMNWPWFMLLLALVFAVYGALRGEGVSPLLALFGAYFVASLPLLDTHVALAGYADLPMAATYTMAALAFYRWAMRRDWRDAVVALALALCCPLIKTPGFVWALLLLPGVIVALMPQRGLKVVGIIFAVTVFALLALARSDVTLLGYHLQLDFQPQWQALGSAYFLSASWHLLWYVVLALVVFGARQLKAPRVAPLAVIVASGLGFLLFVSWFTNASAWLVDQTTLNRASLHLAPLVVVFSIILWRELTEPLSPTTAAPEANVASIPA